MINCDTFTIPLLWLLFTELPPLGFAQFKILLFLSLWNGIPTGHCYVVQFHWLKYDPLGYATNMLWHHWFQLEMTKMLHHCMCFWPLILCSWFFCPVLWESLLKGIKSIRIFQVCMLKLSPLSKFLHGRWRKELWCLSFSEQKAVSTPPVQAIIAYCGLQGFGTHFSPNNLECKAPCDSN